MKILPFQKRAIRFLVKNRKAILQLPTGQGKTVVTIELLKELGCSYVVICPPSIQKQWQLKLRRSGVKNGHVMTYGEVKSDPDRVKDFNPDIVVMDEPKLMKSESQFSEAFLQAKIRPKRRLILDATVIENSLIDVWMLFRWINPKLFGPQQEFRSKFMRNYTTMENLEEFRRLISPHLYQEEVKEARRRIFFMLRIPLPDEPILIGEYRKLCRSFDNLLETSTRTKNFSSLMQAFGKISKMRSLLGNIEGLAAPKMRALLKFIDENHGNRGVIFVYRKDTAERIRDALRKRKKTAEVFTGEVSKKRRESIRERFNAGEIDFIVATSAGERGIDLPSGNLIVHFDLPWTDASYRQRDRVTRISSDKRRSTKILTLIYRNSIEEVMWSIICAKRDLMIKPFNPGVSTFKINRKSWRELIRKFLGGNSGDNPKKVNEATGEGVWFTRG